MRLRMKARLTLGSDEGFTLVELLVSMVLISGVLLSLVFVQVSGLKTVSVAKQRQQATALADQVMEELRALPYDTVRGGLRASDIVGDANVVSVSGVLHFKPSYTSAIDEQLVTSTQTVAPLYPHVQPTSTTTLGHVKYDVRDYVTLAGADPTVSGYWLTVVASWTSGVTHGKTKSIALRSRYFSPTGCLSTATHPFSGPCQAFLDATADTSLAGVVITPQDGSGLPILSGHDATQVTAELPSMNTQMQSEQTLSAQAKAVTSGVSWVDSSNNTTTSGGVAASAATSTDPGSGTFGPAVSNPVSQSASSLTLTGSLASLLLGPASSDAGRASSTLAAASGQNCTSESGTPLAGGQACGAALMTPAGTLSAQLKVFGRTENIASIAAPSSTDYAFSGRFLTGSGSVCASAATPGCAHSGAVHSLGNVTIGDLMSGSSGPAGFSSMVTVSGYQVQASSESGVGTSATPGTATRSGTLSYWNGTGYTSVSLSGAPAPATLPPVSQSFTNDGHNVVLTMSGQVDFGAVGTAPSGASPCQPTACSLKSAAGGVVVTLFYTLTVDGATAANFAAATDLGSAVANSTYRAAPSA